MLIHRIMRAPSKRVFKIDIGNIPPAEVDNYMQRIINKMKKTPIMDEATGEYNLKYNMQNLTEDFFMPVRGGDSGTEISELSGIDYDSTEDIEYLKNKLLASLRVPKAFLGFDENVGGKATLSSRRCKICQNHRKNTKNYSIGVNKDCSCSLIFTRIYGRRLSKL